tara:strand:+ start:81 stop:242 length:162 start_codon:yes stop_codon:yes gene_type:complete
MPNINFSTVAAIHPDARGSVYLKVSEIFPLGTKIISKILMNEEMIDFLTHLEI